MSYLFLLIGILLFVGVVWDILKTTLSLQGGGWFTGRYAHFFWNSILKLSGRNGHSKLLGEAGYLLLVSIILIWVLSLYSSFVFLLLSSPDSIINSSTKVPADLWEKIYYGGYVLSTLGNGDFIASTNLWRLVTNLYALTGLILITMSITYFVPVLSAIIKQRKLGINLSTLGNSPQQILLNAWNGENFDFLINQLQSLSSDILEYNQNHRAYPVIHYFHISKKKYTIILGLARLNEAVFILQTGLNSNYIIPQNKLASITAALNNYVEVITDVSHLKIKDENQPQETETSSLKEYVFFKDSKKYNDRMLHNRLVFSKLIEQDGWKWKDIFKS